MAVYMRRGALLDGPPSPLPQEETRKDVVNTQIVNGFWQFLPAKSTTFLSRVYFRNYPRPLFVGNFPPYPYPLPVVSLTVPSNQGFILKNFEFQVYEQSGIGAENIVAVDPSRVASYFGFEVKIDSRSPYDFNTNVTARAQALAYNPVQAGGTSAPPTVGQGTSYPFSGPNQPLAENFAAYAVAGQKIEMNVYVLREPQFDVRLLSAKLDGYNLDGRILQTILSRITA